VTKRNEKTSGVRIILAPEDFLTQPKDPHLIIPEKNLLATLDVQRMMVKLLHKKI
jgi:hypothetical protein